MIQIGIASRNDFNTVLAMAFKLQTGYGHQAAMVEEEIKLKEALENRLLFVALSDSKPIGYLLVRLLDESHPHFPNSIFLNDLFVEENYRKQGIGKKLVEFALSQDYPPKYQYFSVTHSPKEPWLTKFYESLGFEQEGMTDVGNVKLTKRNQKLHNP